MYESSNETVLQPDSDLQCQCGHTCFYHAGEAGTGRCIRCTCAEFTLELEQPSSVKEAA